MLTEVNFDGIIGPTHHFGGLGVGNLASQSHRFAIANPRAGALQGLQKATLLHSLGLRQAFLPPLERPNLNLLESLGFRPRLPGGLMQVLDSAPELLSAAFSASGMWSANAATITPSTDALDRKLHLTPANLISSIHRGQEAEERWRWFQTVFQQQSHFAVHDPLPAIMPFRDEGAANHMRLSSRDSGSGIHLFVFGENESISQPSRFVARQTQAASKAIARRHQIDSDSVFFLQQNPAAIDAGVFHNDVIATSHEDLLLYHQDAFLDAESVLEAVERRFSLKTGRTLSVRCIHRDDLPLVDAVRSYLFNSQIVTIPDSGARHLICPDACQTVSAAMRMVQRWLDDPELGIEKAHFVELNQSMFNGGGPACLRLRIAMTREEMNSLPAEVWLTDERIAKLEQWVKRWYRDSQTVNDFVDPELVRELEHAYREFPGA